MSNKTLDYISYKKGFYDALAIINTTIDGAQSLTSDQGIILKVIYEGAEKNMKELKEEIEHANM